MTSKFNSRTYRLLFWSTFFYGVALLIRAFEPVTVIEPISYSYSTQVYKMGFRTWLYNSVAMTALLTNLAVSFDRYLLITNRFQTCCTKIPVLVLICIFFILCLGCFCFPLYVYYTRIIPMKRTISIKITLALGNLSGLMWFAFSCSGSETAYFGLPLLSWTDCSCSRLDNTYRRRRFWLKLRLCLQFRPLNLKLEKAAEKVVNLKRCRESGDACHDHGYSH